MTPPIQLPPDLHVHTEYSIDAIGKQLACVDNAIRLNMPGIGFAEHLDFDPDDPSTEFYDYQRQREGVGALADLCLGEATIFFGVEVTYQASYEADIRMFIEDKSFDYRIGSLHHAGNVWVGKIHEVFDDRSPGDVYIPYFREYLRMVETGLFDVAGHLDYPKRYCEGIFDDFKYADYSKLIDPILDAIIRRGMTLELNTGGWRRKVNEQYPSTEILHRYKQLGGNNVSYGSDAHNPAEVGADFERAVVLANKIGLHPVVYAAREMHPI